MSVIGNANSRLIPNDRFRYFTMLWTAIAVLAQPACGEKQQQPCVSSVSGGCYVDCTESIDAYCASQPDCHPTWDEVLADPGLCGLVDPVVGWSSGIEDCGAYHVLLISGEGGAFSSYYDAATGKLVALIYIAHDPALQCAGGPIGRFTPPEGCGMVTFLPLCSADAGTDAR